MVPVFCAVRGTPPPNHPPNLHIPLGDCVGAPSELLTDDGRTRETSALFGFLRISGPGTPKNQIDLDV